MAPFNPAVTLSSQESTQSYPPTQRSVMVVQGTPESQQSISETQQSSGHSIIECTPSQIPVDPQISHSVLDIEIQEADDFLSWSDRTTAGLSRDNIKDTQDILDIPLRKRKNFARDPDNTSTRRNALDQFEVSLRVLYLCDFGKVRVDLAKKWHFDKLSPVDKAYCYDKGHVKALNLFNSWKHKAIQSFERFIAAYADKEKNFRRETEISRCQQAMEDCFSVDNFVSVFQFVKGWIDLDRSGPTVKKWCKVIWIDLGACLKMKYNNEKGLRKQGANSGKVAYNKLSIFKRYALYSTAKQYDTLRPDLSEVKMCIRTTRVKEVTNHDDPQIKILLADLYVPMDEDASPGNEDDVFES